MKRNLNCSSTIIRTSFFRLLVFILICLSRFLQCHAQADRESWQPTAVIMDSIGIRPGMIIGEAGAGRGYFTFPLAHRLGSKGLVYANDIWTPGLESIKNRAQSEGFGNIITVKGESMDPLFPRKDLDMSVMVYVLHEISQPVPFLANLKKYLKKDGMLVIIERKINEDKSHVPPFLKSEQILDIAGQSGFSHVATKTFLTYDNIYIFK